MKSIEFIGPSCIGKTTFLNELVKRRTKNEFITKSEALRLKKRSYGSKTIIKKLLQKLRIIKQENKIKEVTDILKNVSKNTELLYEAFLIGQVQKKGETWTKVRMIEYYSSIYLLMHRLDCEKLANQLIVFEEGLIHNGGFHRLENEINKFKSIVESSIFPKGVIALIADRDTYIKRIHKRFETKGSRDLNSIKKNMSDKDISDYVDTALASADIKTQACKKLGVEVLEINAVHTEKNFIKTEKFMRDISNSFNI